MKESTKKLNIFIIYLIMLVVVIASIGMVIFQSYYINPLFIKEIIKNAENQAIKTAEHLGREISIKEEIDFNKSSVISKTLSSMIDNMASDYNLFKIKVFSRSGEVLYSTSKRDIGKINEKHYFHDIVAKGNPYTKVVTKNTKGLEDEKVASDVVETYVPIMRDGVFVAAFEIYYDITARKSSIENLVLNYKSIHYLLTLIVVSLVLFTLLAFRKHSKEQQRYEKMLLEIANTDKLTGLHTRRLFLDLLQIKISEFERSKDSSSLILFDIDHFKKVNDTYGHGVGDDVLVSVAHTCKQAVRKNDIVARYGGEEFIMLLPNTNKDDALRVAEKIRASVESSVVSSSKETVQVTISLGVACLKNTENPSADALIDRADKALYKAKNNGRNQICADESAADLENQET